MTPSTIERKVTAEEAERSIAELLKEVAAGATIRIERDGVEVGVLAPPRESGKKATEILEELRKLPRVTLDDEFARDLLDIISSQPPIEFPKWD